jgi:hypothetical protein
MVRAQEREREEALRNAYELKFKNEVRPILVALWDEANRRLGATEITPKSDRWAASAITMGSLAGGAAISEAVTELERRARAIPE